MTSINSIVSNYNTKNYLNSIHIITHDGYDANGPESNIEDLYVAYRCPSGVKVDHFHREDWFTGEDDTQYELMNTASPATLLVGCYHDKLKSFLIDLYKLL